MSGFDLSELLPFYLDETDEHIAALNDALLRLEQDPTDVKALAEAFRMFHSIKGASVVMGFEPVNRLTHQSREPVRPVPDQEADARSAGARPDLPLPRRAARLPPRAPGRGTGHCGPRGVDPSGHRRARDHLTGPHPQPQPEPEPAASSSFPAANAEAAAQPAAPDEQPAVPEEGLRGTRADRRDGGLRAEPAAARHEGPAGA